MYLCILISSHNSNLPATYLFFFFFLFLGTLQTSSSCLLLRRECHNLGVFALCPTLVHDGINLKNILGLIWAFETNVLWIIIPEWYHSFTISIFHFLFQTISFWLHIFAVPVFLSQFLMLVVTLFTSVPSCPHNSMPFSVISGFSIHRHVCNTSSIASLKPAVEVKHNEVLLYLFSLWHLLYCHKFKRAQYYLVDVTISN